MIATVLHPIFLKYPKICTDTRVIEKDALFFALKGENFDGNKFAKQALENGAAFAVIDDQHYFRDERYILVDNVLETLQNLATYHRKFLGIPIISLTGSNGKTTTKELINVVLRKKYRTVATKGNLNNHIGVPLTLLTMNKDTEIGIVELGANHPKEIEFLANIAKPNFGLITNFGKAHLEGFGNFEGVVNTKTELYAFLKNHNGIGFVNNQDAIQKEKSAKIKRVTVGQENADVIVKLDNLSPYVSVSYHKEIIPSNMIGLYNFTNIAYAILIGNYFKVSDKDIKNAIASYKPTNNRSQILKKGTNTIILDAYNANPSSMNAALENLKKINAPKKAVFLGDMFELGKFAAQEHQNIVNLLKKYSFDKAILIGEHFYKTQLPSDRFIKCKNITELPSEVQISNLEDYFILIKGSRGMQLERLLDGLK
ncbi:MAG TPA: UDP-N-acetylmuramoyl-tripeptide--D-alanyl-D-alanine ligase [Flavobacteriia bacterium]|nr:UDP-N-acetylmuramoyl-tripeptide--D-alanyl-D-alanine ligase [Flavobacteriia bacterium]